MFAIVFPTHVGMNRFIGFKVEEVMGVPHTCGDEPVLTPHHLDLGECSPHMWG